VRDEQPHREKRSSPLFFDHDTYGNCHGRNVAFSDFPYLTSLRKRAEIATDITTISNFSNLDKV
jgi:hypothetical protein